MKLKLDELKMLAELNCYDTKYDLFLDEAEFEDREQYISNINNFDQKIEDWFFDWHMGRTAKVKLKNIENKYLYFYKNGDEIHLVVGEELKNQIEILIEKIMDNYSIKNKDDYLNSVTDILFKNNYDLENN